MRRSGEIGSSEEHLGGCVSCVIPEEVEERHGGSFAMHNVTKKGINCFLFFFLWLGLLRNVNISVGCGFSAALGIAAWITAVPA